jgi:hypothetical protein
MSPGFIWRLQTSEANATYLRPYDDDRILFNVAVWETSDALNNYIYRTVHFGVVAATARVVR